MINLNINESYNILCRGENYAERRKQLIQESKYLGGDMEHTHLVKGLDYALLEKVKLQTSVSLHKPLRQQYNTCEISFWIAEKAVN